MIEKILEVKASAERELLYAQAKLEAVNEILELAETPIVEEVEQEIVQQEATPQTSIF